MSPSTLRALLAEGYYTQNDLVAMEEEERAEEDESSPEEEDNDGSDYEPSKEDASASQEDVSDYEGMPADVKDREVYQFSPEDQRRMRFRR